MVQVRENDAESSIFKPLRALLHLLVDAPPAIGSSRVGNCNGARKSGQLGE